MVGHLFRAKQMMPRPSLKVVTYEHTRNRVLHIFPKATNDLKQNGSLEMGIIFGSLIPFLVRRAVPDSVRAQYCHDSVGILSSLEK